MRGIREVRRVPLMAHVGVLMEITLQSPYMGEVTDGRSYCRAGGGGAQALQFFLIFNEMARFGCTKFSETM